MQLYSVTLKIVI